MKRFLKLIVVTTLIIFLFASTFAKSTSPEEVEETEEGEGEGEAQDQEQDEMMANLFLEMGLDKTDYITRDNLRILMQKLFAKIYNNNAGHESFIGKIIDKYTEEVPERFTKKEIGTYLTQERIMKILQETVKDSYGDEISESILPALEEMGNAYKEGSTNVSETEVSEGQSADSKEEDDIEVITNHENRQEL